MSVRTGKRGKRRAQGRRDRLGHASQAAPDQRSAGVSTLFAAAAQRHQSGRLAEAEALYRQILEIDSSHVEALHNLGVLAHQTGRYAIAEDLLGRAITLNDRIAHFHQSLANTLRIQGKLEKCVTSCQRAIALKPDFAYAHYNLALALSGLGRLDDAAACFRRAVALEPNLAEAHCYLGAILLEQDELDQATVCFRRAIEIKPDFAEAHNNLGNAHRNQGRLDDAAASYGRAIALKPDFAEAHNNLGNALRNHGRLDDAAASYRRAIDLKPGFAEAHYNLGVVLKDQGKLDAAAASYQCAIDLKPDFAEALYNLGIVLTDQGRLDTAAASYQRAVIHKPGLAEAHYNLGIVLKDQGSLDEAAASHQRAIDLKPDFAKAHCALSAVLMLQGQPEDARASAIRATELEPDRAESWVELGDIHGTLGEVDLARAAFLRALQLDPLSGDAVFSLSGLLSIDGQSTQDRAFRERVSHLAAKLDHMPPARRVRALFAMSKLLEDQGDYDGAFASMARANAMVRADLSFDIAEVERRLEAIAGVFDRPLLERLKDLGCDSRRPIFIVGMPRSGTTLVEQIVSTHPQVFGAGELPNLPRAVAARLGASVYPGWARTMRPADGVALAQTYLDGLPSAPSAQVRITDKMVTNFQYLGLIHLFLPNARIIHCRRDPRDVCLSCFAAPFGEGHQPFTFDLVELGRYWRAYDRLMAHWRAVLPPGRVLEVPYEEVVEDVETWARRLIGHCGLEWDDACLRFYESGRPVHTASVVQVRRPIYASSVGRWRRFTPHLTPLLETLDEPRAEGGRTAIS